MEVVHYLAKKNMNSNPFCGISTLENWFIVKERDSELLVEQFATEFKIEATENKHLILIYCL